MPNIEINMLALLLSVVAGFFISYLWYTPLFGKIWNREMGFDNTHAPQTSALVKSLLLTVFSVFLIAFVMANNMAAWTPGTWGSSLPPTSPLEQALQAAFFTWIGFFVSNLLLGVAWEKRSWTLFAIDAGYYLALLLAIACITVYL
jgi:hypothetical protein